MGHESAFSLVVDTHPEVDLSPFLVIGILCGLVWGLWVGFAILAAGTFLGEIATWVAFKRCCQIRAAKQVTTFSETLIGI